MLTVTLAARTHCTDAVLKHIAMHDLYSAWLQVQSCILKTVAEAKHCLFTLPEVKYRKAELRGCRVLESGHADGRQPFEQHHPLNETIGTSHAF